MKKILFFALALANQMAFSQRVEVISNEEIPVSASNGYLNSVLSPSGDYVLVTKVNGDLQKYDLTTKKLTTVLPDIGINHAVQISSDGSTIVYQEKKYINKLRYTTLKTRNLDTGEETTLIKETRDLEGVSMKEGTVLAVENGKLKTKEVAGKKLAVTPPITSIQQGQLYITVGNDRRQLSPAGTSVSYLWNSVSPDGTKILYYVIEHGKAYVCDIDGSNPASLGVLRAGKWMGNNWIIGMVDQDNGEVLTASKIVVAAADGTSRTYLTDDSVIATNPTASADASKIVYNTADGRIFLMKIKTNK